MKGIAFGLALTMVDLSAHAQDTIMARSDFVVIHMERNVDRPAQLVWSRVGGYCQIEAWLGTKCIYTVGNGDIGTNRQLNGTINELMVAKTPLSYAYAQPTSQIFYHGNLAVEVVDSTHSRIVYDLLYDAAPLGTSEAKAADIAKRKARFEAGIDKWCSCPRYRNAREAYSGILVVCRSRRPHSIVPMGRVAVNFRHFIYGQNPKPTLATAMKADNFLFRQADAIGA